MAKLRKAKNLSLVKDVSQQIEEAILSKEYLPGDRLPSTRQLQEILGASLGTIRESLAILEQKGLLEVRKGAKGGFFVKEISTTPMINSLETLMDHMVFSHRELYEFRIPIEAELTRMVAQKSTPELLDAYMLYIKKMEACIEKGDSGWRRLIEIEQDLRRRFLEVVGNRIYTAVLTPILDRLTQYGLEHLTGTEGEVELACGYWKKIIQAIANGDGERASHWVTQLLKDFEKLIIRRIPPN